MKAAVSAIKNLSASEKDVAAAKAAVISNIMSSSEALVYIFQDLKFY